jgi:hypothetical protein
MPAPIEIQSPPADLNTLLHSAMPELEALHPERYVRRSVSRPRALELTNILLTSWAPLTDVLDMELSPLVAEQRKLELCRLSTRVWIFYKADLASEEVHANTIRKQRRGLARAVAEHDRFLFKWALPVFGDHPEHAETLRDISRGTGARDDAEDVLRLADLYLGNWKQVEALQLQHAVSKAYIDQAVADATRQLDVLTHGAQNPARRLADAAYSQWFHDYNQLMHLGRYLNRDEPDVVIRFPGVRELATRSGGTDDVEDEVRDDGETDDAGEAAPVPVGPVDPNAA